MKGGINIQKKIDRLKLRSVQIALETGLLQGHRDYTRFVILGRGRSGSNFLTSLLKSHNQVICFGEIFNNSRQDIIRWRGQRYTTSSDLLLRESDPIRFISTRVFSNLPKKIKAVGFKIFYYHAQEEKWKCIWPYLKNMTDLRIIHLKRRNLLRYYLSQKIALMTNQWTIFSDENAYRDISVELSYKDCLKAFEQTHQYQKQYQDFFVDHPIIDVFYEDLSSNTEREIRRIESFLGVTHQNLQSATKKQARQPLSEMISNYTELKSQFYDTSWLEFFDD